MSKMLQSQVAKHNEAIIERSAIGPAVALAPLPAGAQFLNVIESVFSGMVRAIIANSDYPSINDARAAIDRYILTIWIKSVAGVCCLHCDIPLVELWALALGTIQIHGSHFPTVPSNWRAAPARLNAIPGRQN